MKKIFYAIAALSAIVVSGCTEKPIEQPSGSDLSQVTLTVTSDNPLLGMDGDNGTVNFKTFGGEVLIDVTTNQDSWSYTNSDDSWLDVSADKYYLKLAAGRVSEEFNTAEKAPKSTVVIRAGEGDDAKTVTIEVSQNWYGKPEVSVAASSVSLPAVGELSFEIPVTTSQDEWSFEHEPCTWLLIEQTENSIVVTADPNSSTLRRETEFTVKAGFGDTTDETKISVSQDGLAFISLTSYVVAAEPEGKTESVTVNMNPELTWTCTPAGGDYDWITIGGSGNVIDFVISPSDGKERTADFTITVGEGLNTAEKTIRVYQIGEDTEACIYEVYVTKKQVVIDVPRGTGTMNYTGIDVTVDWGDGTAPQTYQGVEPSHKYETAGYYTVISKGTCNMMRVDNAVTRMISWGKYGVTNLSGFCNGARNLRTIPNDINGSFENVTTFANAFQYCPIESIPEGLFAYASKVTTFNNCFEHAPNISSIPEHLFDNCPLATNYSYCFHNTGTGQDYSTVATYAEDLRPSYEYFVANAKLREIPEGLFSKCTAATNFGSVFSGTGIKTVPAGIFANCPNVTSFNQLFFACMLLESVPEDLFKGKDKVSDIQGMFRYCYSIKTVPGNLFADFSATAGPSNINYLFNASGIESIPAGLFASLPRITGLSNVFQSCSKLTSLPAGLFDAQVNVTGLSNTFQYCTGISSLPEGLFRNMTKAYQFNYTFADSGIESIPADLFNYTTTTSAVTLTQTFKNCEKLKSVPEHLFDKLTTITTGFSSTFWNCYALESVPEDLFRYNTKATTFSGVFQNCTSLKEIPAGLFKYNTAVTNGFSSTFNGCTSLKSVPRGLFTACTKITTNTTAFQQTFANCTALEEIPDDLFEGQPSCYTFNSTFMNCTSLKSIPAGLFKNQNSTSNFSVSGLFSYCTSLTSIPANLFANQKTLYTVQNLFYGCTGLKGESCYDEVNGQKIHLYERTTSNGYTRAPGSYSGCYTGCTGLSDYESIPTNWR